jgi:hypothetical protein
VDGFPCLVTLVLKFVGRDEGCLDTPPRQAVRVWPLPFTIRDLLLPGQSTGAYALICIGGSKSHLSARRGELGRGGGTIDGDFQNACITARYKGVDMNPVTRTWSSA